MRFTRPDAICGIMCSAQKTLGVGMPLIAILYDASTEHASGIVALPLLMYHPLQLVMDTLITGALARASVHHEPSFLFLTIGTQAGSKGAGNGTTPSCRVSGRSRYGQYWHSSLR